MTRIARPPSHEVASLFNLLGNPVRLEIVRALAAAGAGGIDMKSICEAVGQSRENTFYHMSLLSSAGFIEIRQINQCKYLYRLVPGALMPLADKLTSLMAVFAERSGPDEANGVGPVPRGLVGAFPNRLPPDEPDDAELTEAAAIAALETVADEDEAIIPKGLTSFGTVGTPVQTPFREIFDRTARREATNGVTSGPVS